MNKRACACTIAHVHIFNDNLEMTCENDKDYKNFDACKSFGMNHVCSQELAFADISHMHTRRDAPTEVVSAVQSRSA